MKKLCFILFFSLIYFSTFAQDTIPFQCGVIYQPLKSSIVNNLYWEEQIIPYEFEENTRNVIKSLFLSAVQVYENNTNLCFIPKWTEEKTLLVRESPNNVGYGSSTRITIPSIPSVVIHEIGHAIGLQHEHQRPDRDNYITINEENIEPNFVYAFNKMSAQYVDITSTYDYRSVMHYYSYAFSKNGKKTIEVPDSINTTLGNSTLSPLDIAFINQKYPKTIDCDSARWNRRPTFSF